MVLPTSHHEEAGGRKEGQAVLFPECFLDVKGVLRQNIVGVHPFVARGALARDTGVQSGCFVLDNEVLEILITHRLRLRGKGPCLVEVGLRDRDIALGGDIANHL